MHHHHLMAKVLLITAELVDLQTKALHHSVLQMSKVFNELLVKKT